MDRRDRRDDWTLIIAIVLIAIGGWLLLRQFLGDWFPLVQLIRVVSSVFWPLVLIGAGLLLYFAARNQDRTSEQGVPAKRFYRSRTDRMIGGVLGGLAKYLNIDATWLRIGYVIVAIAANGFPAVLLYIVAMIVVPEEPPAHVAETQWPQPSAPASPPPPAAESGGTETVQEPAPPAPGPEGPAS